MRSLARVGDPLCPFALAVQGDLEGQLHRFGVGDPQEPLHPTEVRDPTVVEVEDAIRAQLEGLLDTVFDDDDRVTGVRELPEDFQQVICGEGVKVGQRLVNDVEAWPQHQRPGHREQLALTTG